MGWRDDSNNHGCPCHGCNDRHMGCHGENGNCPHGYIAWAEGRREKREAEYRERQSQETISHSAVRKMWIKSRWRNQQPVRRSGKEH